MCRLSSANFVFLLRKLARRTYSSYCPQDTTRCGLIASWLTATYSPLSFLASRYLLYGVLCSLRSLALRIYSSYCPLDTTRCALTASRLKNRHRVLLRLFSHCKGKSWARTNRLQLCKVTPPVLQKIFLFSLHRLQEKRVFVVKNLAFLHPLPL